MHSITIGTIYCKIYIYIYIQTDDAMSHYNISVKRMASVHILTCVLHSLLESDVDFEPFSAGIFSPIVYPQCRWSHVWCQTSGTWENWKISVKFPFCSYNLDFYLTMFSECVSCSFALLVGRDVHFLQTEISCYRVVLQTEVVFAVVY